MPSVEVTKVHSVVDFSNKPLSIPRLYYATSPMNIFSYAFHGRNASFLDLRLEGKDLVLKIHTRTDLLHDITVSLGGNVLFHSEKMKLG